MYAAPCSRHGGVISDQHRVFMELTSQQCTRCSERTNRRSSGIEFQAHTLGKGKSTAWEGDRGSWGVLQRTTALWGHGHAEQRLEGGDLWIPGDGVQVERRVWTITSCLGSRGAPGVILLRGLQLELRDDGQDMGLKALSIEVARCYD